MNGTPRRLEPHLTFVRPDGKFGAGVTKSRFLTVLVGLLYLSVALVFGVIHHHEHDKPLSDHHDCPACTWHIAAVTDVPLVRPLIFVPVVERPLLLADCAPHSVVSFAFCLSRAPPVNPA
ncbi:MAG TPA: hypothetical protein VL171_06910 [Verrucomicrobiae bacterium]|nr:hypothetical protein [Verrucomicrobiae bacterium]